MLYFTVIVRESDCLALAADTENTGVDVERYKVTSKNILRKLINSQTRQQGSLITIDSSNYHYHVLCSEGVMFLTMCESNFNSTVAFAYLEDVSREFLAQYGSQVPSVSRPYPFIKFDLYLQKTKKVFTGGRASAAMMQKAGGMPPVVKKSFRDVMGYADSSAGGKSGKGGSSSKDDTTTLILIGGGVALALIFIIIMIFVLM